MPSSYDGVQWPALSGPDLEHNARRATVVDKHKNDLAEVGARMLSLSLSCVGLAYARARRWFCAWRDPDRAALWRDPLAPECPQSGSNANFVANGVACRTT